MMLITFYLLLLSIINYEPALSAEQNRASVQPEILEFHGDEIFFIDDIKIDTFDLLQRLRRLENPPQLFYGDDAHDINNGAPKSNFTLFLNGKHLSNFDIAHLLGVKTIFYIRPSRITLSGRNFSIQEIINIYADELKNQFRIEYGNENEYIYFQGENISLNQLFKIIFEEDKTYIFDHSKWNIAGHLIEEEDALNNLRYIPDLRVIYKGEEYSIGDFIDWHKGGFLGKYRVQKEAPLTHKEFMLLIMQYTIFGKIRINEFDTDIDTILKALQHIPNLETYAPDLKRRALLSDEFDVKEQLQLLQDGKLLKVQEIIALLRTKGKMVLGNMELLQHLRDVSILYGGNQYSVNRFRKFCGDKKLAYQIVKGSKILNNLQIKQLSSKGFVDLASRIDVVHNAKINDHGRSRKMDARHLTIDEDITSKMGIQAIADLDDSAPKHTSDSAHENIGRKMDFQALVGMDNLAPQHTYSAVPNLTPSEPNAVQQGKIYTPKKLVEFTSYSNPRFMSVKIWDQNNSPKEFQSQFPDSPNVPVDIMPQLMPLLQQEVGDQKFMYGGKMYTAQQLVQEFALKNPSNISIKAGDTSLKPKQVLSVCRLVNPNLKFVNGDGLDTKFLPMNVQVNKEN